MSRHQFRANSSSFRLDLPIFIMFLGLVGATGACTKPEKAKKVFGLYEMGKTTPADVGACRKQDHQIYCSNNPSPAIGGNRTQTDLFFDGHDEEKAPLVEILTAVFNCRPGEVSVDLHTMIGDPTKVDDKKSYWKLEEMTVIALLPQSKGVCTVHFLDHSEKDRIIELFPLATP